METRKICESILELVNKMDADIILFQEYYINSYVAEKFEEEMGCEDKDGKYVLKCNHNKNKQPLHTVAFCRDDKKFKGNTFGLCTGNTGGIRRI